MIKACFLALVLAVSAVLLKNLGWRGAPVFTSLGIVLLISELLGFFAETGKISFIFENLGDGAAAMLKIIGLGYLFGISSEICKELGENGISSALSLVGRFEIIAVAIPFISEIFSLALSLV